MLPYFSKLQIAVGIGFFVVLLSIPLGFALLKDTQTFQSKAQDAKTALKTIKPTPVTRAREVPQNSPLTDLQKLLSPTPIPTTAPSPTPEPNLSFGPTLNIKITLEGRAQANQAGKVFVGLSLGASTTKPKYVLTFTVDFPASGVFSDLSLAGLNPGSTYTAYIKGPAQIDKASTFVMSATESTLNNDQPQTLISGDLNEDNTINSQDFAMAKNLYGTTPSSSSWNLRTDLNADSVINNMDLAYIIKNFGKTGDSGVWYSTPPPATPSAQLQTTPAVGGYETSTEVKPGGGYWLWIPPAQ